MSTTLSVIVVGAGLGGLTLALALGRAGARATVLEQAAGFGEAGAGVQLSPNAARALFSLGLEAQVRAIGLVPDAAEVRDHRSGRLLLRNRLGDAATARWGAPYLQVHRADLHAVLLEAAKASGAVFHLGARAVGVEDGGVRLADGGVVSSEVVVGCDGVRSAVRGALWGEAPARFTGQVAWRGTVASDRLPPQLSRPVTQVWTGAGRHFVHYPVRGHKPGHALVNFIAVTEEDAWRIGSWSEPGDKALLAEAFTNWPDGTQALIAASDAVWRWALYDRPPLARWSPADPGARATLLGDAAHPMLPFLAQGAAMAIEDAVVLSRCLSRRGESLPAALARYEAARRARTAKVQAWSRRNALLFHLPAPLAAGVFGAAALLDGARSGGGAARFDWLYGYDAARVPL